MAGAAWLVAAFAVAAAYWDLARRRIPNALTIPAALTALSFLVATGRGPLGAGARDTLLVTGALAGLGLLALHHRVVGAGDVKLFLALSLLAGPPVFAHAMLLGSVACAVWALACWAVPTLDAALLGVPWLRGLASRGGSDVPLAVPYALGLLVALSASLR